MEMPRPAVWVNQEVTPQVLSVINDATKTLRVVTPYLDLWRHIQIGLQGAVSRGVDVRFVIRDMPENREGKHVQWLLQNKIKVHGVEGLHAKIYYNESKILLSSMNITESSTANSMEIAIELRDRQDQIKVRQFVDGTLLPISKLFGVGVEEKASKTRSRGRISIPTPTPVSMHKTTGFCIRCGRDLYLKPSKPLCDPCYDSWAEWQNEDYPENFCHVCGSGTTVTYAKPLCRSCYARRG